VTVGLDIVRYVDLDRHSGAAGPHSLLNADVNAFADIGADGDGSGIVLRGAGAEAELVDPQGAAHEAGDSRTSGSKAGGSIGKLDGFHRGEVRGVLVEEDARKNLVLRQLWLGGEFDLRVRRRTGDQHQRAEVRRGVGRGEVKFRIQTRCAGGQADRAFLQDER